MKSDIEKKIRKARKDLKWALKNIPTNKKQIRHLETRLKKLHYTLSILTK